MRNSWRSRSTRSAEIANSVLDPARLEGHVLAYRQWLANPTETIGVRLTDDAMHPILPVGSIVAVDRSVNDPLKLSGQIVAVRPDNHEPMIRWLDISGRHVILRPNQSGKDFPLIPIEYDSKNKSMIIGKVVWSWSRFGSNLDLFCFLLAFESVESDSEANRASVLAGRQVERLPAISLPAFRDGFH